MDGHIVVLGAGGGGEFRVCFLSKKKKEVVFLHITVHVRVECVERVH